MSTSSDHQLMEFYQQIAMDEGHYVDSSFAFSHATAAAVAAATASENILSPSSINSCSMSDHQLVTPKGHVSKPPVRRRSRASKKTPTTLLNANANNFRALVQQFTGCPSKTFSFASKKGPINLNFGLGNDHHQSHEASVAAAIGNIKNHDPYNSNYYQQQQQQQQPQHQQQQISCQEQQQGLESFDNISDDGFFATTGGGNIVNPTYHGFVAMDDDDIYQAFMS